MTPTRSTHRPPQHGGRVVQQHRLGRVLVVVPLPEPVAPPAPVEPPLYFARATPPPGATTTPRPEPTDEPVEETIARLRAEWERPRRLGGYVLRPGDTAEIDVGELAGGRTGEAAATF